MQFTQKFSKKEKTEGPWNDWFHAMGHTYGTWLPGDPRSFRTRHHRKHIEGDYRNRPPKGKYEAFHEHAKRSMKCEAVILLVEQRIAIVRLMVESLRRRNFEIPIASLTDIHFHILGKFPDHNPRHWIGIAKKESSHHAKQQNQAPAGGLWAVRTKSIPINSRAHQINTAKYLYDHLDEGSGLVQGFCASA